MILLVSCHPFLLSQAAGNGNVYSYTATTDLIILNWGNNSAGNVSLGTWVNATSGVLVLLRTPDSSLSNGQYKVVITSGSTLYVDNVDINNLGICIGGIEL